MLSEVKTRSLACGLIFILCAAAPQAINADDADGLSASVMPATNRTTGKSTNESVDEPLVIALAEPDLSILTTAPRPIPPKKNRSWPAPARFFTINQVLSKPKERATPLEFASVRPTDTDADQRSLQIPPTQGDEPFGLYTFRAPDGVLSEKWRNLEADIDAEKPALERCRADAAACTPAAARFVAIVKDAAGLSYRAKLRLVNERVNGAIRYTEDWAQWHQADVWSAPLDVSHKGSFDTGMGDCEDYAIAKYVALRQAGFAEKDLRVLLVKDRSVHLDHAVLAARDGGHWVILDNRWSRLTDDNELRQFVPLFALDQEGAKMFAMPYAEQAHTPNGSVAEADSVGTNENVETSTLDAGIIAAFPALSMLM